MENFSKDLKTSDISLKLDDPNQYYNTLTKKISGSCK